MLFFLIFSSSFAQPNKPIEKGYIINSVKDTIEGEFYYVKARKLYKSVSFRNEGTRDFVQLTPDSIRAYYLAETGQMYISGKHFLRKKPDRFLLVITRGDLSLFVSSGTSNRSTYWAVKDSILSELKKIDDKTTNIYGGAYKIHDRPYLKVLTDLTQDCIKDHIDFELNYYSLRNFGLNYADCKGESISTYKERKSKTLFGYTIGLVNTPLTFVDLKAVVKPYERSSLAPYGTYDLSTLDDQTINTSTLFFGFSFTTYPASLKTIAFDFQFNLAGRKWSLPSEGIKFQNFYAEMAPALQYYLRPGKELQLFIDIGLTIGLSLSSKFESQPVTKTFVRESPPTGSDTWPLEFPVSLPLFEKAEYKPTFYSPFVSLGLSFPVNKAILTVGYRYGMNATLTKNPLIDTSLGYQGIFLNVKSTRTKK